MRKVLMMPTPQQAMNDTTNSINQIVLQLRDHLPEFGYELTENRAEADLIAGHAGQTYSKIQVDVAHCHGLYPTAYPNLIEPWHNAANQSVINNIIAARSVTAPSEWVADILRRDMHINPAVIPWAIDFEQWSPGNNGGYVLWNKTRVDGVCDPKPIAVLAQKVSGLPFVSTFADNPTPNLKVIGRQPYDKMRGIIRGCNVYLATTKETGGIGILEAMACGVPVLGYRHGNVVNLVQHGITGYLVEPGDIEGLVSGLDYCIKHRATLGANARAVASLFTWDRVARIIAGVYDQLFIEAERPRVAVIIPCYNYARYINEAIESVARQVTTFGVELIVVDDGSTDDSLNVARKAIEAVNDDYDGNPIVSARVIEQKNAGVASARNAGIIATNADYICCLDADDRLGSDAFLATLAGALDDDRGLGIVYSGLRAIDEHGVPGEVSKWPNGFEWEAQISGRNQVPTCCLFRRDAWRRAGGYKSQYQPSEDAELWTRIVSLGFAAKQVVSDGWFEYRFHDGSLSDPIRKGKRPEPDWRTDKPYINDKQFPLAAAGIARPVRNYDRTKVSIIVPVASYHVPYLGQALDSIERQTERYWECIVVNDTGAELSGLGPYPWAKVIDTGGGKGAGAARNAGAKHASASLLTFLDADDFLLPRFLEATLKKYQTTGRYVYTDWFSVNKAGQTETNATPEFVVGDVFQKPTQHAVNVLIKRTWFDQVHGFNETMVSWEDVDFFMRLGKEGICGVRVAEPLFVYRYLTGQRREKGETIKGQIIASLNETFGEYIRGEKMCGCINQMAGQKMSVAGSPNVNGASLVRILYTGPIGQHEVAIGKHRYGYRSGGDTFYVHSEDVAAYPSKFVPIAEVYEEKRETPVPPPPPVIRAETVAA